MSITSITDDFEIENIRNLFIEVFCMQFLTELHVWLHGLVVFFQF